MSSASPAPTTIALGLLGLGLLAHAVIIELRLSRMDAASESTRGMTVEERNSLESRISSLEARVQGIAGVHVAGGTAAPVADQALEAAVDTVIKKRDEAERTRHVVEAQEHAARSIQMFLDKDQAALGLDATQRASLESALGEHIKALAVLNDIHDKGERDSRKEEINRVCFAKELRLLTHDQQVKYMDIAKGWFGGLMVPAKPTRDVPPEKGDGNK